MKSVAIFLLSSFAVACGSSTTQVQQNSNTTAAPQRSERMQSVTAHTTENQPAPIRNADSSTGRTKWSQSGDPIDTSKFDTKVAAAEKSAKAKPFDEAAKKAAAEAYFERGYALTEARQYASALGDFRRALKYDPSHSESKNWIDQIVMIYSSLNKEHPKEGEEPPPLPFKKT